MTKPKHKDDTESQTPDPVGTPPEPPPAPPPPPPVRVRVKGAELVTAPEHLLVLHVIGDEDELRRIKAAVDREIADRVEKGEPAPEPGFLSGAVRHALEPRR